MNRGIRGVRWVPAKLQSSLGQSTPAVNSYEQVPQPVSEKSQTTSPLVYGGLILVGLAVLWAVTRDAKPDYDRSWE